MCLSGIRRVCACARVVKGMTGISFVVPGTLKPWLQLNNAVN